MQDVLDTIHEVSADFDTVFTWDYARTRSQVREQAAAITRGDPNRGEALFIEYGCGSCHAVQNVRTATGNVGPPLVQVPPPHQCSLGEQLDTLDGSLPAEDPSLDRDGIGIEAIARLRRVEHAPPELVLERHRKENIGDFEQSHGRYYPFA